MTAVSRSMVPMRDDHRSLLAAVEAAILKSDATLAADTRSALARREAVSPPELAALRDKIFDAPSTVSDADVNALLTRTSETEVFEAVVASAFGAARARLDAALSVIDAAAAKTPAKVRS